MQVFEHPVLPKRGKQKSNRWTNKKRVAKCMENMRSLKNVHICSSSRKGKILTTGIHWVFRGLKFEPDVEIGQKGGFCKGLTYSR